MKLDNYNPIDFLNYCCFGLDGGLSYCLLRVLPLASAPPFLNQSLLSLSGELLLLDRVFLFFSTKILL